MNSEKRKKLAAFYTPETVTDTLSRWAIRSIDDTVLEPSFGGCNFLISSIQSFNDLGCPDPNDRIYGFDIDTAAFETLKKKQLDNEKFIFQDFLTFNDFDAIGPINVILGNPPYVPIHKIEKNYKQELFKGFKRGEIRISKRSGLWIYFIVHSLKFLSTGGRMAWVLPDSLAFTEYGQSFLRQLETKFTTIKVIRIDERYFADAGTKEKTAILLCEGFNQGHCTVEETRFTYVNAALRYVSGADYEETCDLAVNANKEIGDNFLRSTLGEIFNIKIGIVVGATNLLVFDKEKAKQQPYYPNFLYPIISKGKQLQNITVSKESLIKHGSTLPYLIVDGEKLEKENILLFEHLVQSIPQEILLNQTFRNRTKLFGYDDLNHPDAFLTFFSQGLPKLVINENKELNCTNSVHRLYAKKTLDSDCLQFIAIQIFSGFYSDEISSLARPYGNSIRKFEPSDARKIPILLPKEFTDDLRTSINKVMAVVINNIELNNITAARKIALDWLKNLIAN